MGTQLKIMEVTLLVCFLLVSVANGIPRFLGPNSRTVYIDENLPTGSYVMTVYASDPDGDPFTFNLTSRQFSIGSRTGVVTVRASPVPPLDREVMASIPIIINLIDSVGMLAGTLMVTVNLNDLNDNAPVWNNPINFIPTAFPEDSPLGTLVYVIVVTDADTGANGDIRFRIQSPMDGTFGVNAVSGVVTLERPLDFDTASMITITVIAEDQGSPSLSLLINFTVSISAVVSSPPVFTQTHYFVNLDEGNYATINMYNIITVLAVPSDDSLAGNIVYSQVMRGVPSDSLFNVTRLGVVNAIGNLDREVKRTYDLQIEAYIAIPGLPNSGSDVALVTVTVLDVNDNSPVFENPHPNVIVLTETTPVSTVIYTFYATDEDEGTNGQITYEIVSPVNSSFSIGSTSGVVLLVNSLNHDTNPTYTITVRAQDGGLVPNSATNSLTVNVADVVSAAPAFTENVYNFEVAEGDYTDYEVGTVRAVDGSSSAIRYQQIPRGDDTDALFSVTQSGMTAGRVALTGTIDRENRSTYIISVKAFRVGVDGDRVPQSEVSIVSVVIIVTDVNDHSPLWTSTFSPITIPESHPVGTNIFTATATDADSGSNGRITYSFVSPQADLPFSIGASNGIVRLSAILDYDSQISYTLNIQAQDGGSPSRSISGILTVNVMDTLDLAPIFNESVYSFDVTEGSYTNELVGSVSAEESLRPNTVIRYEKVSGDEIFTVESSGSAAGNILLTGTVDSETVQTYIITIRAFRVTTGTTPRSDISTVSVIVTITDLNDNVPVWDDPSPGPITLVESRPVGTNIFTVSATDADSGTNGEITYSFLSDDEPFSIGVSTGIIRLTNVLDYTINSQYMLNIRAQDGGIPPQTADVTLTINILDVLDPPPTFTESAYTEEILEGTYMNELVGTVRAIDPLRPNTAILRYEKVDTGDTLFTVTPNGLNAGQVTVSGTLDRETTNTHTISIRAFRVVNSSSTIALSDVSVVSVLITVTDENDNIPIWLNPSSTPLSLLETRSAGSIIYTLHATDLDEGSNAAITYTLISPTDSPFAINSGSGVIRVTNVLDYDVQPSYVLTLRAQDSGSPSLSADTMLTVNIVDVLDPAPAFSLTSYSVAISEGTYTNHLLTTVEAVDSLHPNTAVIRYEKVPQGDDTDQLFTVVATGDMAGQVFLTGTVSLSTDTYSINIRAFRVNGSDNTPRSGISTIPVTITITDINDNSPIILNTRTMAIQLIETRPVGSVVYTYHAVDSDEGDNGIIAFSIAPLNTPFSIDATTGVVRLTSSLDYDVAQMYTLTITAQDSGVNPLSSTTVLNIIVLDVTDPPPSFTLSQYAFSVTESQSNVVVGSVRAVDNTSPTSAIIRYQQVDKEDITDSLFSVTEIGVSAGEIRINAAADREVMESYTISIRAFRVSSLTSTTPISGISIVSVVISIDDINDNPPIILNQPTEPIALFESRQVGSVIYTVYATDADEGTNADITYVLTAPTNGPFSVGSSTGIVRVTSTLDYDSATSYNVEIRAQDGGLPQRTDTTTLTVNIMDVLDPPPSFTRSIYTVGLNEGTYSNEVLLSVQATDTAHPNAILRYERIIRNDETDHLFSVGVNGEVTITGILDRESENTTFTTNIRAFRVASLTSDVPLSAISVVSVVLTVLDINDNQPEWLNRVNQPVSVLETSPIGTVVYSLIVSDSDEGLNGRISFVITTSPTNGLFAVDQMGVVTLNRRQLDFDVTPSYTVVITATDQGTPSLSSIFQFTILVIEASDPPPSFNALVYSISAPEADYTQNPLHVTDVTAIPGTVGNTISYSIQLRADGSHSPFVIAPSSGSVDFMGVLDRETKRTWTVVIMATEMDPVTSIPVVTAHSTVILTVTDVNDNPPTFITDHIFGSVSELARIGDLAAAGVRAFDADEGTNKVFSYSIPNSLPFAVDPVTGFITVNGPLDYETRSNYQFMITAQETRTAERFSSMADVDIVIVNENENTPIFSLPEYRFQVPENNIPQSLTSSTPAGLSAITASDVDQGTFGDITYSLVGFGVPERFMVSQSSGVISTTSSLNYEERAIYHLTLIAQDGGGTLSNPNRATTQIIVEVLDINDHAPVCFPASTSVILEENRVYSNFLTISGSDGDPPNTNNSRLSYNITFADGTVPSSLFTINSDSGEISADSLNYEAVPSHMYNLIVTVSDAGSPVIMTATCSVTVNVRDFNDAAPRFSQSVYNISIMETHRVGTVVGITVMATDPETEHSVEYFPETADPDSSYFLVGRTSGIITLGQSVDYDPPQNNSQFTFRVLAIDDASPPLTGTTTIIITITPENDNAPVISNPPARDPLSYNIVEDMGTPIPSSLLSVDASDVDGDVLTYSFITNNRFFSIGSTTGDITLISTLDRESQPSHTIVVQACDPGRRCDSVTILVTVTDYNDHQPNFGTSSLTPTVSVRECDIMDEMILATVQATDVIDLGPHREVTYSAVSGDTSRFSVGMETGVIRLQDPPGITWDYEAGPNIYSFTVRGTDFPGGRPQQTTPVDSVLTFTLTDCNDFPPVFTLTSHSFVMDERTIGPVTNEDIYTGIVVTDGDASSENRNKVFSIINAPTSTNNWFGIDSSTGNIHILSGAIVDRENPFLALDSMGRGVMSFNVLVVNDASTGSFSSTATVTVTINDINDHNPVIEQTSPISVTVIENSLIGTFLHVISAVDVMDYGDNAHIVYEILSGNEDAKFAINRNTGVLTVAGNLDHENRSQYQIRVQAREDIGIPLSTPDTVDVIITVINGNDNSPEFDSDNYTANLLEFNSLTRMNSGVSPGERIATVHATDMDSMTTLAGRLQYRILSGAMQLGVEMFRIPDPNVGEVIILRPDLLDYEGQQRFDVSIEAHDLVTPTSEQRQDTILLTVNVIDVNDVVPMFADAEYTGTIEENLDAGAVVTVTPSIRGLDADNNSMDQLTFSVVTGPPFNISSDGHIVRTTSRLDRELLVSQSYRYVVTIQVRDTGGNTNTAILTITVADVNDNPPCFPPSTVTTYSVEENRAIFPDPISLVGTIQAVDLDVPTNPMITYFISSGDMGDFDIDSQTGDIYVISPLNREEIQGYLLNITTTDGDLTCGVVINITVMEINDNDPRFLQNPYLGSVIENADPGTNVDVNFTTTGVSLEVEADDIDRDPVITYSILSQQGPDLPFAINSVTGSIFTNATLDREAISEYTFMVQAHDGLRRSTSLVEIIILDFNDRPPMFVRDFTNITVPEHTPANFVFLFVEAMDEDIGTNSEIIYSITSVNPPLASNMFNISEVRGAIFANSEVILNEKDPQVISLTITASNLRSSLPLNLPVPTANKTVEINIAPQNINAPQFNPPHYTFNVTENENGSIIGVVMASEPLGDVGTLITYSIVGTGSDDFLSFEVDEMSGSVTNVVSFDREERDLYQFSISAMDNALEPRFGFATVNVRILDDNDNAPVYRFGSHPVTMSETTLPNTVILTILVSDADIGPNAILTYTIAKGNTSAFALDPLSGELRTLLDLDREEIDQYNLTVTVQDSGSPALSSNTSVIVTIGDVNDNSPRFIQGAVLDSEPVMVAENVQHPWTLTTLQAIDEDAGGNADVVYTFENFAATSGPFQVDRNTGVVSLRSDSAGNLDRETQDRYEVTVVASDQGGLGREVRSTPATFYVVILDVNDNVPTFEDDLIEFQVSEDSLPGTVFGRVSGTDRDIGTNAILFYHIIDSDLINTTCSEFFCVNHVSGDLYLNKRVDYEKQIVYLVTVAVSNERELQYNATTRDLIAATDTLVRVEVLDANDEAPVFVPSSPFAAVTEEAEFGSSVTRLRATDADTGNGSVVWFSIESPDAPFVVEKDTGEVTTAGVFRGQSGTSLAVQIRAYDNFGMPPTQSNSSILTVLIFKCREQVELSFQVQKEVIEANIDRIISVLMEVTQSRVIISSIRVRQTNRGTVDLTGTDVNFFALNENDETVLDPGVIIRVIDENYGIVQLVFEEYDIVHIEIANCANTETSSVQTLSDFPTWLWVVIAIIILAFCCLCCCCLLICIGERRKRRKWQHKALKADLSQLDQFSQHQMTDMSMFGQENPYWTDPYPYKYSDSTTELTSHTSTDRNNPLYESQELTIEMFQEPADTSEESDHEPADQVYESQEILLEMFSDNTSEGDSHANLIKAPERDVASPLNQDVDDLLEQALDEADEYDSNTTTFI